MKRFRTEASMVVALIGLGLAQSAICPSPAPAFEQKQKPPMELVDETIKLYQEKGEALEANDIDAAQACFDPRINLGFHYFDIEKDYTEALKHYSRALEIDPNSGLAKAYKEWCEEELRK